MKTPLQTCFVSGNNIGLCRGTLPIFSGVNLSLAPEEVLMIHGTNGSGKTSLLRILAGFSTGYSGQLKYKYDDQSWVKGPALGAIGWLGHKNGINFDLSVEENLKFWKRISRTSMSIAEVLEKVHLPNMLDQSTRNLSAGQQRRLGLARLLLANRPVWILDEPVANLDKDGVRLIEALLLEHTQNQGSAIIASHEPLHPKTQTSYIQLHQGTHS